MTYCNAGLSLYDVDLQCSAAAKGKKKGQRAQRSAFLFTHRGYSGPSVLDLSHSVTRALERGTPLPSEAFYTLSSFVDHACVKSLTFLSWVLHIATSCCCWQIAVPEFAQ